MAHHPLARPVAVSVTFLLALLLSAATALAAVGSIVAVSGQVSILRGGKLPAQAAQVGATLEVGDFVRTKSSSTAQIRFNDGNVIKVAPRSRIDISEYAAERDTRTIGLARGKIEAVVVPPVVRNSGTKTKRFEIHTPNAVAGVRGTDLVVFYEGNATGVLVIDLHGGDDVYAYGLSHPDQQFDLPAGYLIYIRDDLLPEPRKATPDEVKALIRDFLASLGVSNLEQLLAEGGNVAIPEILLIQPAYEVGRVDMTMNESNGLYNFVGSMTASFLAPSAGGEATNWVTENFSASWSPQTAAPAFDPNQFSNYISGTGPNGSASAFLTFDTFDTASGNWSATLNSGFFTPADGGTTMDMAGALSGTGASSALTGSLSGSGGGTVVPTTMTIAPPPFGNF